MGILTHSVGHFLSPKNIWNSNILIAFQRQDLSKKHNITYFNSCCLKFLEKGEILENYNLLWLFSDKRTVKKAPKKVF